MASADAAHHHGDRTSRYQQEGPRLVTKRDRWREIVDTGRRNADGIAGNLDTVQDDSRERRTVHIAVAGVAGEKNCPAHFKRCYRCQQTTLNLTDNRCWEKHVKCESSK